MVNCLAKHFRFFRLFAQHFPSCRMENGISLNEMSFKNRLNIVLDRFSVGMIPLNVSK